MSIAISPQYKDTVLQEATSPPEWQNVLNQLPLTHPLQSWAWGEFKSRWGWSAHPLYLQILPQNPPQAAALVLKRKIPNLPFSMLYVPKGPLLDYNDGSLRRVILTQLEHIARQENAILIKIDPDVVHSWGLEPERPSPIGRQFKSELTNRGWLYSNEQVQFQNTVTLALGRPEDELLADMKQKTRYNIRLAGRKEVVIRTGTMDDFPTMVKLYQETAQRDGFTIRSTEYYLDAWRTLHKAGGAHLLIAEYEGKALAGVMILKSGKLAIYMYGASTNHERKRMPNYLLQWEAIRWAQSQGCELYDFWGAPDNFVETDHMWGVWRFKAGFNGQVVRHIGAWDFPARPFWYRLYAQLLPKYIEFLRHRNKS